MTTSPVRVPMAALLCLLAAGVCSGQTLADHSYSARVSADLARLTVEARFSKPVSRIFTRSSDAARYLLDARDCDSDERLRARGSRLEIANSLRCLAYEVDLAALGRQNSSRKRPASTTVVTSPSLWLWRPRLHHSEPRIDVRFELPQSVKLSVPWTEVDGDDQRFLIGPSPQSGHAVSMFGPMVRQNVEVPGAVLRVAIPDSATTAEAQALARWVGATATDVSLVFGRYPNPSPQVVVLPSEGSRSSGAVPFGRVIRDGGEAVQLFVNTSRDIADYYGDWTATHEFSHLMLPYLDRGGRWISEGFAQYYQNVLLARAGVYDDRHAWQKIYEGFERGRAARPELSPNEAAAGGIRNGLMKIYWSGAALALLADVELREQSAGELSLDAALDRLQRCCLPAERSWTGRDLFERLDELLEVEVFLPLYEKHANTPGFPDTGAALARLGIQVNDGQVTLRDDRESVDVRRDIVRVDAAAAGKRMQHAR